MMPYAGQPSFGEQRAPSVVVFARVYAIAFSLMYLLCTAGGIFIIVAGESFGGARADEAVIQGIVLSVVGFPLAILSVVAAAAPRKKWGWGVNVALMGLGCTSCACMPFAIPLLVFWLKPETKAWYGMG